MKVSRASGVVSLALSIKSGRQVTQGGFPRDFVRLVWDQWFQVTTTVFEADRDLLGLVVGELAQAVWQAWCRLQDQAAATTPARLVERVSTAGQISAVARDLFSSLECPQELTGKGPCGPEVTARLLRQVVLLGFDFQATSSVDLSRALETCQQALEEGSFGEAERLWDRLVGVAAELRPAGGSLEFPALLSRLRHEFRLKGHPDHEADWARLHEASGESAARVRKTIGGRVTLPRPDLIGKIQNRLAPGRLLMLVGDGGSGKSAAAKNAVWATSARGRVLWLDDVVLQGPDLSSLAQRLGLRHPVPGLMEAVPEPLSTLVLDGVDRFTPAGLRCAVELAKPLLIRGQASAWCVVATVRHDALERLTGELHSAGVPSKHVELVPVEGPSLSDVLAALGPFPDLRQALARPELSRVATNLKALDWIARGALARTLAGVTAATGLTDIIAWIWEGWIGPGSGRLAREGLLKKLGRLDGDSLTVGVGLSRLDAGEHFLVEGLSALELVRVLDQRVHFHHDLLGDWARLYVLIEEVSEDSGRLLSFGQGPRWHAAIRLLGQWLVERDPGLTDWLRLRGALQQNSAVGGLVRDLLLEGLLLATSTAAALEALWTQSGPTRATFLNELLGRFLYVATLPHPLLLLLVANSQERASLSPLVRIPVLPLWPPVLQFLHRHSNHVARTAQKAGAEVCLLWLRSRLQGSPWCREAAEVALAIAREVQALHRADVWFREGEDRVAFEAGLQGALEMPDEVAALALELARRRPDSPQLVERAAEIERELTQKRAGLSVLPEPEDGQAPAPPVGLMFPRGRLRSPYADGPTARVEDNFREAVLNPAALVNLIMARPAVAREVLLAVCLEEAQYEDESDDYLSRSESYGVADWRGSYPPMYFRGPFLIFLTVAPQEALECIVRLVNQITENWDRLLGMYEQARFGRSSSSHRRIRARLDDESWEWIGDGRVFGWYRNLGAGPSLAPVVSALMALEHWLYERAGGGKDVESAIGEILRSSRSLAFAGVLAALGKKHPPLLAGQLRPLLRIWQLYQWDVAAVLGDHVWQIELSTWAREGQNLSLLASEWHSLPHRRSLLRDEAVAALLNNRDLQEQFQTIRAEWSAELAAGRCADPENLDILIARFDPANYRLVRQDDGSIATHLDWPTHLKERMDRDFVMAERGLSLLMFPAECRRRLDENVPLGDTDAEAIWEKATDFAAMDLEGQDEALSERRPDAVYGGVAVLVVLGEPWLRQRPERRRWCIDRVAEHSVGDAGQPFRDSPASIATDRWHSFLAEAAVKLLAENQDDAAIRTRVAESVGSYWYFTTGVTLARAFRLRTRLGEDFERLQNFAVRWAALRRIGVFSHLPPGGVGPPPWWYGRLVRAFVTKGVPAHALQWVEVGKRAEKHLKRKRSRARTRGPRFEDFEPGVVDLAEADWDGGAYDVEDGRKRLHLGDGLDLEVLRWAFTWLPRVDNSVDEQERPRWVSLYRQLMAVLMARFPQRMDQTGVIGDLPAPYDHWLLEAIGEHMPHLREAEEPHRLWRPLFGLGVPAHRWITLFLDGWIKYGAAGAASSARDVSMWQEMMEYALGSPLWEAPQGLFEYDLEEMWIHLMGLGPSAGTLTAEHAAELGRLCPSYEEWGRRWLSYRRSLRLFAAFLARPAGLELRLQGLAWLYTAASQATEWVWSESGLEEAIISAVRACHQTHSAAIAREANLQTAFRGLLALMISRRNSDALQLRDEIAGRPS